MNSIIFSTAVRALVPVTVLISVLVLLRGHNDPGGGFIGGLLAALAVAIMEKAHGTHYVRERLRVDPLAIAGGGLLMSIFAGLWGAAVSGAFLAGVWPFYGPNADGVNTGLPIGSVLMFDVGVYFVVVGAVSAILFTLEEAGVPEGAPTPPEDEE